MHHTHTHTHTHSKNFLEQHDDEVPIEPRWARANLRNSTSVVPPHFPPPQGLNDTVTKEPGTISPKMTSVLCVYSALFMRFAWVIQPRNQILFACHFCNECVQLNQLRRWGTWAYLEEQDQTEARKQAETDATMATSK